jgi:hypothetical protein
LNELEAFTLKLLQLIYALKQPPPAAATASEAGQADNLHKHGTPRSCHCYKQQGFPAAAAAASTAAAAESPAHTAIANAAFATWVIPRSCCPLYEHDTLASAAAAVHAAVVKQPEASLLLLLLQGPGLQGALLQQQQLTHSTWQKQCPGLLSCLWLVWATLQLHVLMPGQFLLLQPLPPGSERHKSEPKALLRRPGIAVGGYPVLLLLLLLLVVLSFTKAGCAGDPSR